MKVFDRAENVVVRDSNVYSIQTQYYNSHVFNNNSPAYEVPLENRSAALDRLRQHAKTSATHDSVERSESPRCYPGTRLAVLEEIEMCFQDEKVWVEARCIWLSGPAGGGKTAIAQTLAERCHAKGLLVLSFFPSRSTPSPAHFNAVIPSLAYRLCTSLYAVSPYILQAISADPSIFEKSPNSQMEELIIRPLLHVCEEDPSLKSSITIIILDGLDACGSVKEQQLLLSLLMEALTQNDIPLVAFITSRPANYIAKVFSKYPKSFKQIVLDERFSPSKDIKHFLRLSFNDLNYDLGGSWPSDEALDIIVQRSSGQFLYASVVAEYVCSPPEDGGGSLPLTVAKERLRDVIVSGNGEAVGSPLRRVDAVFKQLLGSIDARFLDIVMDVLAWMAIYGGYLPMAKRATLRGHLQLPSHGIDIPWLAKMLALPPATVFDAFNALRSLFNVPEYPHSHQPLHIYHESIFEFLEYKSRAGEAAAHGRIALCMSRSFYSLGTGLVSTLMETQDNDIELMEAVFRFHLPHAHPTKELADSVASLIGFQKLQFRLKGNQVSGRNTSNFATHTLICDTKQTIVSFLHTFYENQKGLKLRWFIARKRLTIFWFFKIKRTCGRTNCSCATRMLR